MLEKDALRKKTNLCVALTLLFFYPIIVMCMFKDEKEKLNHLLYAAVLSGKTNEVISCIEKGASVEGIPREYKIPLVAAINGGHPEVVEILLKHGAKPNLPLPVRYPCKTLLNLSLKPPSDKTDAITHALLSHGADPDATNIYGEIPLRIAANRRNEKVVCSLFKTTAKSECKEKSRIEAIVNVLNAYNNEREKRSRIEALMNVGNAYKEDESDSMFYFTLFKIFNEYQLLELHKNNSFYFSLLPADIVRELVPFSSFDKKYFCKILQNSETRNVIKKYH